VSKNAAHRVGGHSMSAPLERVLVAAPAAAGWRDSERAALWRALGHQRPPDAEAAAEQHAALREELSLAGAAVDTLPGSRELTLDAVYVHDASFPTDLGMVVLRMGKPERAAEPAHHDAFFRVVGFPVLGAIAEPGTVEGGDLVWLDRTTLLAGRGHRTNADGISQLQALLAPAGVDVVAVPLPWGAGPGTCLHLMSLLSVLDETTLLVDREWLAVVTLEEMSRRGLRLVDIDRRERATLACNVLALGGRRLLALAENARTNARLAAAGYDVRTFAGRDLAIAGGGGPTCLTRPLRRAV
jgi:N-dimethylarginine dimethylaminohydrolase